MAALTFVKSSRIEAPAEAVFAWHAAPGALERLTPPWENARVVARTGGLEDGARITLRVKAGPLPTTWIAEHRNVSPGRGFQDVQIEGPFRRWEHTHTMTPERTPEGTPEGAPEGDHATVLEDRIEYEIPFGLAGRMFGAGMVERKLAAMFAYRHRITADDLAAHRRYPGREPLTVAITGATGLVGTALTHFLTTGGHTVLPVVRRPQAAGRAIRWDPAAGKIDADSFAGVDAVVHLAGENIAGGRWTPARKARIRDSRVNGTRLLAETLAALPTPPRVLVSASAVGIYGPRGDEVLSETSEPGLGFLADVCRAWETAAGPAAAAGIRVVHPRIGVVLSRRGGALARMLPPFRLGLGGRIGSGRQYLSWIHLDDAVGALHHAIVTPELEGPCNLTAPEPVDNLTFTRTLGRVLGRPTVAPLPATPARILFGEMADALLLTGARARPERLLAHGYPFRHPKLEDALRWELGRGREFGRG